VITRDNFAAPPAWLCIRNGKVENRIAASRLALVPPQKPLRVCASPEQQGWLLPHTLNIERPPLNIRSLGYVTIDISNRPAPDFAEWQLSSMLIYLEPSFCTSWA